MLLPPKILTCETLPSSKPEPFPFSHNKSKRLTVIELAFYYDYNVKKSAIGLFIS
jgi:hypothetical protein